MSEQIRDTYIRVNNRVIGRVHEQTFMKNVMGSKHFLHNPPAISFDVDTLRQAFRAGANEVQIIDKETHKAYYASITKIVVDGFRLNRGFGEQVALPLKEWVCRDLSAKPKESAHGDS